MSRAATIPCASVLSPTLAADLAAWEAGVERQKFELRNVAIDAYLRALGIPPDALRDGRRV